MTSALRTMLAAITALSSAIGFAQDAKNQGYLLDQNMNIVTSATTGLCVRTSDWTPARAGPRQEAGAARAQGGASACAKEGSAQARPYTEERSSAQAAAAENQLFG